MSLCPFDFHLKLHFIYCNHCVATITRPSSSCQLARTLTRPFLSTAVTRRDNLSTAVTRRDNLSAAVTRRDNLSAAVTRRDNSLSSPLPPRPKLPHHAAQTVRSLIIDGSTGSGNKCKVTVWSWCESAMNSHLAFDKCCPSHRPHGPQQCSHLLRVQLLQLTMQ